MNLCIFCRIMPIHAPGGMQRHTYMLAEGLATREHTVHVITAAHPRHAGYWHEHMAGFMIHYVPGTNPRFYTPAWWRGSSQVFQQLHSVKSFDAIVSADAGAFPYLQERLKGHYSMPCVMIRHGTSIGELRTAWRSLTVRKLLAMGYILYMYLRFGRRLLPEVDLMIAGTPPIAHDALREANIRPERIVIIPNGVDITLFFPPTDKGLLKERLNLPPDDLAICVAGRVEKEKGIDYLLDAFHQILQQHTGVKLVIVGSGKALTNLRQRSRRLDLDDWVIFAGSVANEDMPCFYGASDIFVMPTLREESIPFVVLEAMACGLPVIASDVSGNKAIIEDGKEGFLFRMGDVPDLVDKLSKLIPPENRDLRVKMGISGRAKIVKEYSIEVMVERIESVIRKAVVGCS